MRTLPLDTTAIRMLSTGEVQPVPVWVEVDGGRRPDPNGRQEKDENGTPLWTVGALVPPAQEGDRAELISVRIAAYDRPAVQEFAPVRFDGLVCRVSVNRRTGALAQYFSARGLAGVHKVEKAA